MDAPQSASDFYPLTQWEYVRLVDSDTASEVEKQAVLDLLCRAYARPVRAVIQKHLHDQTRVEDMVQDFFFKVILGRRLFSRADPSEGWLRQLIQRALKHFIIDELRRFETQKEQVLSTSEKLVSTGGEEDGIDVSDPEIRPEEAYDISVMWEILSAAAERTSAVKEYKKFLPYLNSRPVESAGNLPRQHAVLWVLFDLMLMEAGHSEAASHLAISEGDCRVSLHRLKKIFGDNVRKEVRKTISSDLSEEASTRLVDEEIRDLLQIFRQARKYFSP